jgi:hypothetical protein
MIPLSHHHIELVEYIHPRGEDIPLDTNRVGIGHWAFMVDDISSPQPDRFLLEFQPALEHVLNYQFYIA